VSGQGEPHIGALDVVDLELQSAAEDGHLGKELGMVVILG
jgi:hypothetical protein